MCGGGGGSSQPTQQTVTQVTIPPEIMPYAKKLLGTAEDLTYNQPYQSYEGQRVAGLNPLQMQAMGQIQGQQTASQLDQATGIAGLAALQAQRAGRYGPMQGMDVSYLGTTAPALQQYQMGPAQQVMAPGQVGYERVSSTYGYDPERVRAERLREYRMGPAALVSAEQFGPGSAAQYMSPYMQDVVEQQKRAAVQDYARQIPGMQAAGIRAGGRGGTREALVQAEAQRNLATQLGGIQATGLQSAYQQAQQQYNVDQAQRMQAQLANQAAIQDVARQNLQAAMGIQQLGAGQSLQAQLANQQAAQRAAEFGAGQSLQAQLANQQAGLTTGQLAAQQAMQAALANQQAGLTVGQQNLAAQLQTQGLGAQQGLQAQQLNQAAQLQAQQQALAQRQAMEQSRQFGANLGLQGIQQQLAAAGQLGQLGQTQFGQQQAINQAQMAAGSQMQQMEQARLQAAYEDFLNRQRYPYQQLGFMSDLIRGTPTAGGIQSIYGAQSSPIGALAGLGGLYMAGQGK